MDKFLQHFNFFGSQFGNYKQVKSMKKGAYSSRFVSMC